MFTTSLKTRVNAVIFLVSLGFLIVQFIIELGIVYGLMLISDSVGGYILAHKNIFVIIHFTITLALVVFAKRISKSFYKDEHETF